MSNKRHQYPGFTLVEILLVVTIMGIIAALVIPELHPSVDTQVSASAQILVTDLDYARNLAISLGTKYTITIDAAENRYILSHTGSDSSFDSLPEGPFRNPSDPDNQHITDYDNLPHIGPTAKIVGAYLDDGSFTLVSSVEFNTLGETTAESETIIWLVCSSGLDSKYVAIKVNPVTGLATLEEITKTRPSAL